MSLALTTTHENCYFQRSIGWFSATPLSVFIAGCGVLTVRRVRNITPPSLWRPASADNGLRTAIARRGMKGGIQ